jgi:hypothetical protein
MIAKGIETDGESWLKSQILWKCNYTAALAVLTTILSLYFSK